MESVKWLWALKEPLAAPKELPRSFLRAKMKVKVAQKSSTEPFESSENDLKIKNVNIYKTIEKSLKNIAFSSSEGLFHVQICIEILGAQFRGSSGHGRAAQAGPRAAIREGDGHGRRGGRDGQAPRAAQGWGRQRRARAGAQGANAVHLRARLDPGGHLSRRAAVCAQGDGARRQDQRLAPRSCRKLQPWHREQRGHAPSPRQVLANIESFIV